MMSNWSYPTDIRFGCGRLAELPEACKTLKINNPLFIIDRFLTELESFTPYMYSTYQRNFSINSECEAEPSVKKKKNCT